MYIHVGNREIKINELDLILLYIMDNFKKLMLGEIEGHIEYDNIYLHFKYINTFHHTGHLHA